jgi:hypothetical protein
METPRDARGQANHEDAHIVGSIGVRFELNLASIPYMGSPEGLRHFCPPDHTSHSVEGVMISK